jgi:deoxyribodipyrimidine photolyase-related protein
MLTAALVYPHQLYTPHPATAGADVTFLVEDPLFFRQYAFHKQKLMLHRASMKRYAAEVLPKAKYIDANTLTHTADVLTFVTKAKCDTLRVVDPNDDWLTRRLRTACADSRVKLEFVPDPHFLTPQAEINAFAADKKKLFFTDFYIRQRKRLKVMLTPEGKPVGGKWSFDADNRKKLPAAVRPPAPSTPAENEYVREARKYVSKHFTDAPGSDSPFVYPTNATEARAWLSDFLEHRLAQFGDYEDAISHRERVLFHSVLTPALNVGLLSPQEVTDAALAHADRVPLNSLEGFVRQVIGWREFVRLVYRTRGRLQRTRNFFAYTKPIPAGLYTGTTGIGPVDHVVRAVLDTAYCHHIERLMILGNFMLLCDLAPDDVYRWFMELFIDAYDWVMVPNVYGMSQFADGGGMTTKPYISGSAYVRKMSDHPKGDWCAVWDALYWRFIDRHAELFRANPRTAVIVKMKEKMGTKLTEHHRTAEKFLGKLS